MTINLTNAVENSSSFQFFEGGLPILISMPHNGIKIPNDIADKMTDSAKKMVDTDWYLDQLYDFALEQGCYLINPIYSRYVIDLNRPQTDENLYPGQDTTGLCPTTQFDRQAIYLNGDSPDKNEINRRVERYWQPYHSQLQSTLADIRSKYGIALLFEAHSIKSQVPRFFEGKLPDFNFGNYNQQSCSDELTQLLQQWQPSAYSKVVNGRFKGGYITRAYGQPKNNIHSVQLELSQATYMDEQRLTLSQQKATQVKVELNKMMQLFYQFVTQ